MHYADEGSAAEGAAAASWRTCAATPQSIRAHGAQASVPALHEHRVGRAIHAHVARFGRKIGLIPIQSCYDALSYFAEGLSVVLGSWLMQFAWSRRVAMSWVCFQSLEDVLRNAFERSRWRLHFLQLDETMY